MIITEKACKDCRRIWEKGSQCPVCKTANLTSSFQGVVLIFDVESDIARKLGITAPGKYAIKV